jgi:hypothetical protein
MHGAVDIALRHCSPFMYSARKWEDDRFLCVATNMAFVRSAIAWFTSLSSHVRHANTFPYRVMGRRHSVLMSLYEAFPPAQACGLASWLEFH